MDDGLPSYDVRGIAQDKQGFMWLGTIFGGLCRFDGYEFKTYTHDDADPSSLSHNSIWCTYVDRSGRLWVGTGSGGLDLYVPESDSFIHYQAARDSANSLLNNSVLSLLEDKNGILWIGTRGGLNSLDPATGRITQYPASIQGVPSANMQSIRCITEDPLSDMLWLGTSDGLLAFDRSSGGFQLFTNSDNNATGIGYNSINAVIPSSEGKLWLATEYGLRLFVPPARRITQSLHPILVSDWELHLVLDSEGQKPSGNMFRSAIEDGKGGIWLGATDGLCRYDTASSRFDSFPGTPGDPDSLSSNVINKLFIDRQGGLWVGTSYGGVNRMRPREQAFRNYTQIPSDSSRGLTSPIVTCVYPDSKGRLWVGTLQGLNYLENGRWTHFLNDPNDSNSLSGNHVVSIAEGADGSIWIGTPNQGLNRWDGRIFHHFNSPDSGKNPSFARLPYSCRQIGPLFVDSKNRLWISGRAYGLDCYENGAFTHRAPFDEAGHRRPLAHLNPSYLDEEDGLWCSSELSGLVRLHVPTNTFEQFIPGKQNGAGVNIPTTYGLTFDGAHGLWLASINGLHHFDIPSRSFDRSVYASDGLPSDAILAVLRDPSGMLWLSTSNGLCRYNPDDRTCKIYQKADGVPSNQFLSYSACFSKDGRFYFGSLAGLCSFVPSDLHDNPTPPASIVLSALELFDRPVSPRSKDSPLKTSIDRTREIELPSSMNIFAIKFSALDFNAPTRSQYSYMLQGYDSDWHIGHRRSAYYMNLLPGTYTFKVRGANSDNIWSTQGVELRVKILPVWYASPLFRWSLTLVLFGSVFALVRLRMHRMRERTRKLTQLVSERTHELQEEIVERRHAEDALRESHSYLEERVSIRTAELADSNARLKQEVEDRKRIEADLLQSQAHLRQSQKMEAFGQLAGGISHDFNNILTVIVGQAQSALHEDCTEAERLESIQEIQEAAQRATHLTRQLLVFSRKQAVERKPVDLVVIVADLAKMLRRILGEDLTLRISPASDPHPIVGDVAMIEQVLINLAVNARDAMPEGGQLQISFTWLAIGPDNQQSHPSCPRNGRYSCIHVRDTGVGMTREVLSLIFEPFFTTKASGQGTGLGLATSQSIIIQHDGWIEVDSTPGAGTEFRLCLPSAASVVADAPGERRAQSSQPLPHGTACILLVEDEPGVRRSTSRMLQRYGYRVIEAENADSALELWDLHGNEVDLLLTDIVMPGSLNGHALSERLRQKRPDLRVILMSGYDPTQLAARSLGGLAPGGPLLVKPFSVSDLMSTVHERLRQPSP